MHQLEQSITMKKISLFKVNNRLWLQGLIVIGALAISYFDKKPIADTLYLAFITSLTVGYGDIAPQTGPSKIIAVAIGFEGIIFTGLVVAASLRALEMTIDEQKKENIGKKTL